MTHRLKHLLLQPPKCSSAAQLEDEIGTRANLDLKHEIAGLAIQQRLEPYLVLSDSEMRGQQWYQLLCSLMRNQEEPGRLGGAGCFHGIDFLRPISAGLSASADNS